MAEPLFLAIDQGTTSTRTLAFDADWRIVASADRRLSVQHPRPGWAEQDPIEILDSVVATVGAVLDAIGGAERVVAVGLDNQGETALAWDADTGRPLAPAILWHCRRSEAIVGRLAADGLGPAIEERTGLPLDPYFSAGKWRWLLDEIPEVRSAAEAGRLRLGTVDAWLTASLGAATLTDTSTASRTQLFSLRSLGWDPELIAWFGLPANALPEVVPSVGDLGELHHPSWPRPLPLRAMLCDQQAALAGHGAFEPGRIKATYGTGVFVLANAGISPDRRAPGLLTTVAWSLERGSATYAFDGGVFSAGSLLDLLQALGIIDGGPEADRLAQTVGDTGDVRVLPALGGLGAPFWDRSARGVISGLSAASTAAHIARAAIDGIAHRVADVVEAMSPSLPGGIPAVRIDGGLSRSPYLAQRQADLLGLPVEVAAVDESTALGAASMAALGAGALSFAELATVPRPGRVIEPRLVESERLAERAAWRRYVEVASALRR